MAEAKAPVTPRARLTIVETIYWRGDEQPVAVESRHGAALFSDEQPYRRRIRVGTAWQLLDCGWIDAASLVWIENPEPHWNVQPTPGERAEAFARVVELSFTGEAVDIEIPVGTTCRFRPAQRIYIRCRGETKIDVAAFPR